MERMFAPWRLAFLEGKAQEATIPAGPTGCIFCDYPRPHGSPEDGAAREHDKLRLVVHTREHAFLILNKFPYTNGHIMVVPRRHVSALQDLLPAELHALDELLRDAVVALEKAYRPDGMNLGMNLGKVAGAGIPGHLHWHALPRWNGDHNFMPVFADTRVISEGLDDTYARLRALMG